MTILLQGIVGSTAYGLAGPDSDIDRLGIFAARTLMLLGLDPPKESHHRTDTNDLTLHEAIKAVRLMLTCNPTMLEILWLPDYEICTGLGAELVDIRYAFLSAKRVRDAYLGYATSQFHRLATRGDGSFSADTRKRTAKHARHLRRLCHQGYILYSTGRLEIALDDPQSYLKFGERVADGDIEAARTMIDHYHDDFDRNPTVLPNGPSSSIAEAWLWQVRRHFWE